MTQPTNPTLLLGQRVIVTGPNGTRWAGTLTALADQPTAVIDLANGGRISLPQSYTYTVVPRLEDDLREQLAAAIARAEQAEAALAALHQGEEPYEDERLVPTPAQWIWQWNRATPTMRLEVAGQVLVAGDHHHDCFMNRWPERAKDAEARIAASVPLICADERHAAKVTALEARIVSLQAECDSLAEVGRNETRIWSDQITAVRAEHARDDSNPLGPWCGTCLRKWPCATITALDGPAATPVEKEHAKDARCPDCNLPHALDGWPAEVCRRTRAYGGVYAASKPDPAIDGPVDTPATQIARAFGAQVDAMLAGFCPTCEGQPRSAS